MIERASGNVTTELMSGLPKSGSANAVHKRIPFISTSFAKNLWYYALLWPLWWILGIEQLLLPVFLLFELVRFLIGSRGRLRINTFAFLAVLLAVWWLVPVFWVDPAFLDIYLKETVTIWSQAIILILFWNCVRTEQSWRLVIRALLIMAFYIAVAGLVYISGIWRGNFVSAFGYSLPQSLIESSSFFSSIAIRRFGALAGEIGLLSQRLMSFSLSFSSLSMICLLLLPLSVWRFAVCRGTSRLLYAFVTIGLVLCLFYTESRISYLALMAGIGFFVLLRLRLLHRQNLPLTIAATMIGISAALVIGFIAVDAILRTLELAFIDLRPSSWLVRFDIYLVTIRLLPQHPIAGWGVPVRIPGASSDYSAGTHSSYLGMLFQHGIIGLLLYVSLWLTAWKAVIQGLVERNHTREIALFWMAIATAFFMFNLREVADSWWWDQSLTFVVWMMWGVAMTAHLALNEKAETQRDYQPSDAVTSNRILDNDT